MIKNDRDDKDDRDDGDDDDGGVDDGDDDVEEMEREERHYPWVHAHKFHTPFTFVKTLLWWWWWGWPAYSHQSKVEHGGGVLTVMIMSAMMTMVTAEVNISGVIRAKLPWSVLLATQLQRSSCNIMLAKNVLWNK